MKNWPSLPPTILGKRRHQGPYGSQLVSDSRETVRGTSSRWTVASLLDLGASRRTLSPVRAVADRHRKWELNLYCTETLSPSRAADDRKRVDGNDFRVLNGLLDAESGYQLQIDPYDGRVQPEINNSMRTELAHWIYEICDKNFCNGGVFPLTMHLVDRFLSQPAVHRRVKAAEYQLIGAVCLFVASKFMDCSEETCLSVSQIVAYTDYSITGKQLLEMELSVLHIFNWDVFAITPFDFVDHILGHLPLGDDTVVVRVRHHTITFVALCTYDVKFSKNHPPSTVAAACLRQAISVALGEDWCRVHRIDWRLYEITHTEPDYVRACRHQIERSMFDRYEAGLQSSRDAEQNSADGSLASSSIVDDPKHRRVASDTPTDIRDISPISDPSTRCQLSLADVTTSPVKIR